MDLGVRQLPEQEIAQPHLAAGAHHQVRIGQVLRIQVAADRFLIHMQVIDPAIARRGLN